MSPSGFSGKPGKGVSRMRYLFAALVLAAAVFGTAAQAEKRTFIIANNSDGYGVDRCLATGASCGAAVATAYCKAREYMEAASFHKVEREEIAGAVPTTNGTSARDEFVAIESMRCAGAAPSPRRRSSKVRKPLASHIFLLTRVTRIFEKSAFTKFAPTGPRGAAAGFLLRRRAPAAQRGALFETRQGEPNHAL